MIPDGWSYATIESVCARVTSGGTPSRKRPEFYGGDIPWVKTQELQDGWVRSTEERLTQVGLDSSSAKLLPANTILMAMYGATVGKLGVLADEMTCNQASCALIVDPEVASFRFLFYRLLLERSAITTLATGAAQQNLNAGTIKSAQLLFPPLEEQERIAGVLGAFDDLIETNQRLADHLDDLRRTKLSHALGASSATTRLSEAASFVNGRNFTKGADGAGRPVIRTPEVRSGPGGNTVWSSVVADDDRVARAGDILFVWSGTLMVNRWLYTDGLVNQHVFKVIPKDVPDWYVFALIEAQLPWFLGLAKDKATTMGHIQRAHLDEPMTGLDAHAIAGLGPVIEPIWRAALELRLEAQDLTRQRDELLPLLMAGRVRVRDLEAVA